MELLTMTTKQEHTGDAMLKALGLRLTPARRAILAVLESAREPLSIETLHKGLKPRADQATVYRTLETLLAKGVVRQVMFAPGKALYELAGDEHHHLVCARCGRVEDIELACDELEHAALKRSKNFKTVDRHTLELYGVCRTCA